MLDMIIAMHQRVIWRDWFGGDVTQLVHEVTASEPALQTQCS